MFRLAGLRKLPASIYILGIICFVPVAASKSILSMLVFTFVVFAFYSQAKAIDDAQDDVRFRRITAAVIAVCATTILSDSHELNLGKITGISYAAIAALYLLFMSVPTADSGDDMNITPISTNKDDE